MKNGQVIPTITNNGQVRVGPYVIVKSRYHYEIRDIYNQSLYCMINLPETAIVIANALALGKTPNSQLIKNDREYGFSLFDQANYVRLIKNRKNIERLEILEDKLEWAQVKSASLKNQIEKEFQKACSIF